MEGVQVMQTNFLAMFAISLLILVASGCCVAADKPQKDLEAYLQKAFDLIYLATNGLEYPGSVKILNNCIKYNDKACLRTYKFVLEGKKMIKSVSSMKSLDTTLDIIEKACLSKDQNLMESICYGGIQSLYFYTAPEQDAKILNRIKIYPKKLKNVIFNYDFYWFYNRPNKAIWVSAIPVMDINWKYKTDKKDILDRFKKDISEFKDETFIVK